MANHSVFKSYFDLLDETLRKHGLNYRQEFIIKVRGGVSNALSTPNVTYQQFSAIKKSILEVNI